MQQFVLIGSQGSFPLPVGESRIGSDAACQICIRGEGVLPVHAYVSTDGEKVLIRPAEMESSSSSNAPRIAINGKPLNGPLNISGGQELALGQVHMRLLANQPRKPGLLKRPWFRRTLWTVGIIGAVLLAAYLVLEWAVFDDVHVKRRISRIVSEYLLRDDDLEEEVQVHLFNGEIVIKNLKIKERYEATAESAPFIIIPSLTAKLAVWPLLRSGFKDYTDLDIVVNKPEINLERTQTGALNINDIIKSISDRFAGPSGPSLGLEKLSFTLKIVDATVKLNDSFNSLGETRLQNLNIILRQPGPGRPLEIVSFEAREHAVKPPLSKEGKLALTGHINLLDSSCCVDTSKIYTDGLQLSLEDFDLARIFEHFGYAWEPYGKDFKVVLGKPLTGQGTLSISDINHFRVQGSVKSDSLVSIVESKNPPIGNIPMSLDFGFKMENSGLGYVPQDIKVTLRCGPKPDSPADMFLVFDILGGTNPGGGSNYTVDLDCRLQDLLGTDVGHRLGLDGALGGQLKGRATLFTENGALYVDVKGGSEDSYVMVDEPLPEKGEKPPPEQRKRIRQELPIAFDCRANAQPGEKGRLSHIMIESFSLSAPSIVAKSVIPAGIHNLDQAGSLKAEARFKLNLDGRRFCQNFAPILKLFGYTRPVEENFDLEIKVYGQNDLVTMSAEGTAARQWKPEDPSPVQLNSYVEMNAHPKPNPDGSPSPYLSLMLELASKVGKPLNVHLKADCSRDGRSETVGLEIYDRDPEKPDTADVSALRERFDPYIESYLANYDALQKNNDARIVRFYRDTLLNGSLKPSGKISLHRILDAKSKDANRIDFDISLAGKNFTIDMPWNYAASKEGKEGKGRWQWGEESASLGVKGSFLERVSDTKEEADVLRLNIDALKVEGSLGKFVTSVRDLDLFRIANLATLPNLTWTDTAAALSMSGQVNPPAYDFLRSLNIIPADYPVSGNLALQVAYDREKDTLDLQHFDFKQLHERPEFFLSSLDVTGAVLGLRDLSKRLLPVGEGSAPFTENFSALLDEGGPAALLDHLGDNLTVNSFQVDTGPLAEWLCKDYVHPQPGHPPPALIASLMRGDWKPEGVWSAAGLRLSRHGDPKVRSWELLGGRLRNDFAVYGAAPKEGAPRPEAFHFTHDWALKMGLALTVENIVALNGNVLLDHAFVSAAIPRLNYEYKKQATEKCELELKDCLYSHGRHALAHIGSLELRGQPLSVLLNGFNVDIATANPGTFSIADLIIAGGPLPCGVKDLQCDPAADRLELRLSALEGDLPYLAGILNIPPALHLSGKLKDVDLLYHGSLVAFQCGFVPPAQRTAAFPAVPPDDPRLKGLNPETDSLEFNTQLKDVVATAAAGENEEKTKAVLSGTLRLTGRDLTWKDLAADIQCPGSVRQAFSIDNLHVNSLDAKLSLPRAFRAPGMPLDVSAPVAFSTPLDVNALARAQAAVLGALNIQIPGGEENVRKLSTLEQLAVSGSLKAPSVLLGASAYSFVEIPEFRLKHLTLTYPVLTTSLYGGKLTLSDADCALAKARVMFSNGVLSIESVEHSEHLKLVDGDLAAILEGGGPSGAYAVTGRVDLQGPLKGTDFGPSGAYAVTGRVDLQGPLKGTDFSPDSRLSWDGGVKFRIKDLAVHRIAAQQPAAADSVPPWMKSYLSSGERFSAAFAAASGHDAGNSEELSAEQTSRGPVRSLPGLIAGIDLYLAKSSGVEQEHWEFEEAAPTVVIGKGVATVQPFTMKGKGALLGLELQIQNMGLNLTDNTLSETTIFPIALPQTAREHLALDKWPADEQKNFMNDLGNGKIALKIGGGLAVPTFKFPWTEVRNQGKLALFGTKSIDDGAALESARAFFRNNWHEDHEAAAAVADRMGVGLPGTIGARLQGEMIAERIPGLPSSLKGQLRYTGATISPLESLNLLLNPPPDAPVFPPPPNK